MKNVFKKFLFEKRIFVNDSGKKCENIFEAMFSMANLFNIKIVSGEELLDLDMISFASVQLGENVPEPFYRGFPSSVRALTTKQRLFDQLLHYETTYGRKNFTETAHSVFEEVFERAAFRERSEIKEFKVVSETEAKELLSGYVEDLLNAARPLNDDSYYFVYDFICEYNYTVQKCDSKHTAIRLLIDFRDIQYANFLVMSDVMKLVDEMNYRLYQNEDMKNLNLKNQDRKLITDVINHLFTYKGCDIRTCYEKKALWCGLLHHIHYKAIDDISQKFVDCMRGKSNHSVYSEFERMLANRDIKNAVEALKKGKNSGAVIRNLNYILSRCESKDDVMYVINQIETTNGILLLQLLFKYSFYKETHEPRIFKFAKHNKLFVHTETISEVCKRKSYISDDTAKLLCDAVKENLRILYKNKLGKVYIDPAMKKIALPMQMSVSQSGFGVLPRGSRIHLEEGKKVRGFTYWEKVNDIDLSVIGMTKDGEQVEFSWRFMYDLQSDAITFSGDEVSGYDGGSEYFDIDINKMREKYPQIDYLVFCNNVFSRTPFNKCICRAGYMLRDIKDSGKVYEPKTVKSAFTVDCDSTFAYLFALDMKENDFVWLNVTRDSQERIAGNTSLWFLKDYLDAVSVISVYDFFAMMAKELVNDPKEAQVLVTDKNYKYLDNQECIRSYDTERIMALMNS